MIDELTRKVEAAVEASSHWSETGWPATFGNRSVAVPNLKAAKVLPKTEVCREEAVNYWKQAVLAGADTAAAGRKALGALACGDLAAVEDALYLCQYLEKPFEGHANTWIPLYEEFRSACACC
jgi:hypothetical protein